MILTSLKRTGQGFCRMSLNLGLPDTFLVIRLCCGFRGKYHRGKVPFSSHHIRTVCHQHVLLQVPLTFITWLRLCLPGFSTGNSLFFPFHALSLGSESQSPAHIQGEEKLCYHLQSFNLFHFCPLSCLILGSKHLHH